MNRIWVCRLGAIGLLTLFLATQGFAESEKCRTAAACNSIGTKALKNGKVDEAIAIFRNEVFLAETSEASNEVILLAYNNLALAHMRKGEDLFALAWTRLALEMDGKNNAALYHRKVLDEKLMAVDQGEKLGLKGIYKSYAGFGSWNILEISEVTRDSFHFWLHALLMGRSIPFEGEIEGVAALSEREAVHVKANRHTEIDSRSCKIRMRFLDMAVKVDQEGDSNDCEFGVGVDASGDYWKVSN